MSKSYVPFYVLAMFGWALAVITPVLVGLALKVREIAGPDGQAAALGLVTGIGALFALFANPIFGRLSDHTTSRWGRRRPWILGGLIVGLVAVSIIGTATTIAMVLIGWCLAQTGYNAALAAMQATIPDQVPEARRGSVTGIISITGPIAMLSGIAIYDYLPSGALSFVVPGLIALALGLPFVITLRDRRIDPSTIPSLQFKDLFTSLVFNPRKHPDFGWVWVNRFLMFFAYMGMQTYLSYFVIDQFNQTEDQVAGTILIANFCAAAGTVAASVVAGFLSDRFERRRLFVTISGMIMATGLVIIAFAGSLNVFYIGQLVLGAGYGAYLAVDLALATLVLPNPDARAKDLGVLNIAQALPQSIAPAVAPAIIAFGSVTVVGGYGTWFLFGAMLAAIGSVLIYKVKAVK